MGWKIGGLNGAEEIEIERMKEVIRLLECALRDCLAYLAKLEARAGRRRQ